MKDLHFARAPNGRVPLVLRGRAAGLATAATPFARQAKSINQPPLVGVILRTGILGQLLWLAPEKPEGPALFFCQPQPLGCPIHGAVSSRPWVGMHKLHSPQTHILPRAKVPIQLAGWDAEAGRPALVFPFRSAAEESAFPNSCQAPFCRSQTKQGGYLCRFYAFDLLNLRK